MLDRLRRLFRRPLPSPSAPTIVVRAVGTTIGAKRRGLSLEQVMTIAVEETHALGITDDAEVLRAKLHAREMFNQARRSANYLKGPVTFDVGNRRLTVGPD